jgi:HSP20 family protein
MSTTNTPDTPHSSEVRPWSPWRDVAPWGMRFDDLVDRLWSGFPAPGEVTPAAALHEEEKAYIVELDLPGVDREDITIDVADRRLTVTGVRKEKERKGLVRHSTRVTGSFSYGALLPSAIEEDAVTASMADGVLTITLPKAKGASSRRIPVS